MSKQVDSLKAVLRWVSILENTSKSAVSNLDELAIRKNTSFEEIKQGKEVLKLVISRLERVQVPDSEV